MWFGFSKKAWLIGAAAFVAVIALTFGILTAIDPAGDSSRSASKNDSSQEDTPTETPGKGSTVRLYGSVVSLRNLKGLLAQINQIDVCQAPELTAYVTVTAEDASAISKLTKNDFAVTVDGKETKDFTLELVTKKNQPLQTTLVLDHSGSMAGEPMQKAREAATAYVNRAGAQDKFSVIQFDTSIDTLLALSGDRGAATSAIAGITPRGDTALYDAVTTASDQSPQCGRKAIVLLTDGEDTASKSTLAAAINKANAVNTPVFVVGLRSAGFSPSVLREIAEKTGAQYFEAPTPADLETMYQKISDQLGNQYYLSFKLNIPKTNGEHRLKISSTVEGSPTTSERSFTY